MRTVRTNFWNELRQSPDDRGHWGLGNHVVPDFFRVGDYWLVKSPRIEIQGRYGHGGGYVLHGMAFGGAFLQNHRLVIDRMWDGTATVSWDGRRVDARGGYSNGLASVLLTDHPDLYSSWGFKSGTVELPEGVRVELERSTWNNGWGSSVTAYLHMLRQPDGQDGQCGRADGNLEDDTREHILAQWGAQVPSGELIFDAPLQSLLATDVDGGDGHPSAEVCANSPPFEEDVRRCEAALNGSATVLYDALLQGCIIDLCVAGPWAIEAVAAVAHHAAELVEAAGEPATRNPDGWYDGGGQATCDEGCEAQGLLCTEAQLRAHNADVDCPEKVMALIKSLGGQTVAEACVETFGANDDVPNWWAGGCYFSSPARAAASYDCSARPRGTRTPKHRLCYCHSPEASFEQ